VLPYLDIPFQHGSPRVLKLMKRPAHAENTLETHSPLARDLPGPDAAQHVHRRLRPGEDQAKRRFPGAARLARRGAARSASACFKYSPVEARRPMRARSGADDVKQERYERFMELASEISGAKLAAKSDDRCACLVDTSTSTAPLPAPRPTRRDRRHGADPPARQAQGGDWRTS